MITTLDLEKMTTAAKLRLMEELWQNLSIDRDKMTARLAADDSHDSEEARKVNWADAPEVTRDRSSERMLTAQESSDLIHEAAGKW